MSLQSLRAAMADVTAMTAYGVARETKVLALAVTIEPLILLPALARAIADQILVTAENAGTIAGDVVTTTLPAKYTHTGLAVAIVL